MIENTNRFKFENGHEVKRLIVGSHRGRVELVQGSMFSGKTEELVSRGTRTGIQIDLLKRGGLIPSEVQKGDIVKVFKHRLDDRYGDTHDDNIGEIVSHNKNSLPAFKVSDPMEIYEYLEENTAVVIIDEAQFFNQFRIIETPEGEQVKVFAIVEVAMDLAINHGMRVVVGGLSTNFRGDVFGPMGQLAAISEEVEVKHAVCAKCGDNKASRTQRLVNGEPAHYDDPVIMVGAAEDYEPRCVRCHDVPGRDKKSATIPLNG